MAQQIREICKAIADLHVEGLNIRALDDIPETVNVRDCPIIYPSPDIFNTNYTFTRDSFGGGSVAMRTVYYDITYRLCYAPVGSGRGLFDVYDKMVAMAYAFLDAILAIDIITGAINVDPASIRIAGPVLDPAGYSFHGCDITLTVTEFIN